MRRSKSFSIAWSSRPKQEINPQSPAPQPRAAVLHILNSPRLRASAVRVAFFACSLLCAAAQTPAPQLSADLSHSPGWVVISVDDYQSLRAHAFPADRPPDPPPVDAPLTRLA